MLLSIIRSHGADIGTVLMYILSILIIIFLVNPLHECAHGFVAYKLGDRTAKNMGRLTLNPMAHLDYFGAIMMLIVGFGWHGYFRIGRPRFQLLSRYCRRPDL